MATPWIPGITTGVPFTLAGAPSDLALTPGDAAIVASWNAPADNGGSAVTGYHVEATAPDEQTVTADVTDLTVTLSGLVNAATYTVTVIAMNAAGSSTAISNTTEPWPLAAAPTDLDVIAGPGALGVTWTAPTDTGLDTPIPGYRVTATADGQHTVIDLPSDAGDVLINLTNDVAYTVTVETLTKAGYGAAATATGTPYVIPHAPTELDLTGGDTTADVAWTAPSNVTPTGFHVVATARNQSPVVQDVDRDATSTTLTGLVNGVSYLVEVNAVVTSGSGGTVTGYVTPATVPDAPSDLQLTPGAESIAVTWTIPVGDGGAEITGYHLSAGANGQPTVDVDVTDPNATSATLTGLVDGSYYTVTLTALNASGSSSSVHDSAIPFTVPVAVTDVVAVPGDQQLTVVWSAPTNDGGATVSGYHVLVEGSGSFSVDSDVTDTRAVVTGLDNLNEYTVTVTAINDAGSSDPAVVVGTPSAANGSPRNLAITAGDRTLAASWDPPSANGSPAVTDYTVEVTASGQPTQTVTVTGTSTTLTGLMNGVRYQVRVTANNAAGPGYFDATLSAIPAALPDAPTGLILTPGDRSLVTSWTAPSDTGGTTLIGYHVVAAASGHPTVDADVTGLTWTFTGLVNGVRYSVSVTAVNSTGSSTDLTASATPIAAATVPHAPTLSLVSRGSHAATVHLGVPDSDGGASITGYLISGGVSPVSVSATGNATLTGLVNGTSYTLTATAHNSAGWSAASSGVVVTPATVSDAPTVQVTPSWYSTRAAVVAPASNGGTALYGYVLTLRGPNVVKSVLTASAGTVSFTGLMPSTTYTLTTAAGNAIGLSSNRVTTVHTTALPAPLPIPSTHRALAPGESATLAGTGLFAGGSATLTAGGRSQLRHLAAELTGARTIRCEGHADFGGDPTKAWWLGLNRALVVCNALRANGVAATQHLYSYGLLNPVTTGSHRELNRAVIVFVEK